MKKYLILLALILIQGCSSGGGDSAIQTPPPPTVNDTIPPTVTQTVPLDYAIDVQQDVLIQVSFSELMNSSTVTNSSFVVKDVMDNIIPGVITESNTTYIFTPDSPLKFDTSYTVTISRDVTDLANNNLDYEYSWVFYTVTVPGPETPATLDASNLTDNSVTLNGLFTNLSGDTTTVWFEYGLTDAYGSTTPSVVYAADATIDHSADLISLPDKTIHHYRIVTQNSMGIFYGEHRTFRTYITPVTLADSFNAPKQLHLYNNDLYWNEVYDHTINKVSINGGSVSTETSTSVLLDARSFEMDSTHLYFGDSYNIYMKPIGSGSPSLIVSSLPDSNSEYLSYSSYLYTSFSGSLYGINKINIADGSVSTIISDQPYYISSKVIDANGIYWLDKTSGTINKTAHDGSSTNVLAVNLNQPHSLILDSGVLYWAESNTIKSMSTSGGAITTIAENVSPEDMTKDLTSLYFTEEVANYEYNIKSVNISSGIVEVLSKIDLATYHSIESIVVDDTHLYLLIDGNQYYLPLGQILKHEKSY